MFIIVKIHFHKGLIYSLTKFFLDYDSIVDFTNSTASIPIQQNFFENTVIFHDELRTPITITLDLDKFQTQ